MLFIVEQQDTNLAFSDVIVSPGGMSQLFHDEHARTFRASVTLVDRARLPARSEPTSSTATSTSSPPPPAAS